MKILHSADWHLDSPLLEYTASQRRALREAFLSIPGKIKDLALEQGCDLVLLSGDLFDGAYSKESLDAVRRALKDLALPVFIAPGNHDFCSPASPWFREIWPDNVHIFTSAAITSVAIPGLSCRVYGAGYQSMDCPALLEGFQADCTERYALAVLHGAPLKAHSPYCPVSNQQVQNSALDYLALGHIHEAGSFRAGSTLCAWPGCPMGRNFRETGEKGVLIVTLEETARTEFIPLGLPQFRDLSIDVCGDAADALKKLLPPVYSEDHYRVTLTGESEAIQTAPLKNAFPHLPNLQLHDATQPPIDLWANAGEDTLEGIYFDTLRQQGKTGELAAKISRRILNGQEVVLP